MSSGTSGGADPPNANISLRSLAFFMFVLRISNTALKSLDKLFHLEPDDHRMTSHRTSHPQGMP